MKRVCICVFTIYLIFISNLFAEDEKSILIINSYHYNFEWSDDVIKGMRRVFDKTNVYTSILYMDSKRISSKEYFDQLKSLYKLQLRKHKYDIVVAIDTFAYNFILENYSDFNMTQPIYFVGLERYSKKKIQKYHLKDKVSGLLEKRAIDENIKYATTLLPKLKKLYIINDTSVNAQDTHPSIIKAMKKYKSKLDIEYLREVDIVNQPNRFSKYRKNEAIFFIRYYNDKNGRLYKNEEIASFIDDCKLPVFVTDELFINRGALGGKLVDIKALGAQSAKTIMGILNDKNFKPKIQTAKNFEYILDHNKLKQFHIPMKLIDPKSKIINAPKDFLDTHRDFVNTVFIISPFLILLILGLMHNIYLKSQNTKRLKQRMRFEKELLNSLKSPTIWQDKDGEKVDCNARFEEFLVNFTLDGKPLTHHIKTKSLKYLIDKIEHISTKNDTRKEIILEKLDGGKRVFILRQRKYKEDIYNTEGVVTVLTDITTEVMALQEKRKQQEFTIQQAKLAEIGEIFSSIAHQWKSPLVEIAAIAQDELYSNDGEVDEKKSSFVNDIMIQVRYMTNTIAEFQEFIKPSHKKTTFNILLELEKVLQIINHNIKYNYIDVNITSTNPKLEVFGYKNELKQIFLNIINNAKDEIVKYRQKKRNFRGKIYINIADIDNFVQICIEDNAGGINSKYIDKIFDAYFTTKKGGHGIGLYMAKIIIEDKMGGTIKATNTKLGAKFIIRLEKNENLST